MNATTMLPGHVVCGVNTQFLSPRDVARAWRKAGCPDTCYVSGNPGAYRKDKGYVTPVARPSTDGTWNARR